MINNKMITFRDIGWRGCLKVIIGAPILIFLLFAFSGCSIVVGGKKRPLLRHGRIRGELVLEAERRTDERTSTFLKQDDKETLFSQKLKLNTEGSVYHPKLMTYAASIGLGLSQHYFELDGEEDTSSGSLSEYNISGRILPEKKYSSTFFLQRSERFIPRRFLSSVRGEFESMGVSVFLKNEKWPMGFSFSESESTQQPLSTSDSSFFRKNDKRFRFSTDRNFSANSRLHFEFEEDRISDKFLNGETNRVTDRYIAQHSLRFGDLDEHRLESNLNYRQEKNADSRLNRLRWYERLRLKHTDSFETDYGLRYNETKSEVNRNQETSYSAGFTHWLYDSLKTRGELILTNSKLGQSVESETQERLLSFNYTKRNRFGNFLSYLSLGQVHRKQTGGTGGIGIVTNEAHVYTDVNPIIILDRINADQSSVNITDVTGTKTYTTPDDYVFLSEVNGRLRIKANSIGGVGDNITDGETLHIDYNYATRPDSETDTYNQYFSVRQRFSMGLDIYYENSLRKEDSDVSSKDNIADDLNKNTFGAEYNRKGFFVRAEYTTSDMTQVDSTTKLIDMRYHRLISYDTSIGLTSSHNWTTFNGDTSHSLRVSSFGGDITRRLSDKYQVRTMIDYRDEDDSEDGPSKGLQWNAELRYTFRQLSMRLGIQLSQLKTNDTTRKTSFLYFKLNRFF